jgi:hypothetical protein
MQDIIGPPLPGHAVFIPICPVSGLPEEQRIGRRESQILIGAVINILSHKALVRKDS